MQISQEKLSLSYFTAAQSDTIFNWFWLAESEDRGLEEFYLPGNAQELIGRAGQEVNTCLDTLSRLFDCDKEYIVWEALRRL